MVNMTPPSAVYLALSSAHDESVGCTTSLASSCSAQASPGFCAGGGGGGGGGAVGSFIKATRASSERPAGVLAVTSPAA